MHDLARCAIAVGDRALDGHVAACEDGTLTFSADHGVVGALREGDDVQVLVLDEVRGEVRYSGRIAEVGVTTVHVEDLELTSMLQKRQVARVRISQICGGVVQAADGSTRSISFAVVDIGAHGMRISTNAGLEEEDRITFRFPTRDASVLLDAEVLRSQRTATGATQYGCRFVGLQEKDADALFRFVLQTQGAQRRSRLRV
ncbi:hypothetical protein Cch01nite_43060 [Cellulomonas chitinilytica]|uniref:PilZ domain-containing protein n=1 Tax=Cellulomonas chitinilytica TaxID=398759 RepID=A0A919P7K0_9CELL|nr:PilZ domain-containing protein [Cellulomonas chitinilytica]GIG23582.1 hypothetical protein Cch01nite_43060 [Cellulomonas chitinilytica]